MEHRTAIACAIAIGLVVLGVVLVVTLKTSQKSYKTVVSFTTLPTRLAHPTFVDKCRLLHDACAHDSQCTIQINIPLYTRKSVPYVIPDQVYALPPRFKIYRDVLDHGPITKLIGALQNPEVCTSSYIIIVDDDIPYKKDVIKLLQASFERYPGDIVHCMCSDTTMGYLGFGFKKLILMPILHMEMPMSCLRIDDDYISLVCSRLHIATRRVAYHDKQGWDCSFDRAIHDHEEDSIDWPRLKTDDRATMVRECTEAFNNLHQIK